MKKLFFAIAMCIAGVSAHAQRHYFADGDSWLYGSFGLDFDQYYETGVPRHFRMMKEYIDGDTIVSGYKYWKVNVRTLIYDGGNTQFPSMEENKNAYFVREDGRGRQYFRANGSKKETVIYDFSKAFEVGRTCVVHYFDSYDISSDTVKIKKISPYVLANGDIVLMANDRILYGYGLIDQTRLTGNALACSDRDIGFYRTANGQLVLDQHNDKYIDIASDVLCFDVLKALDTGILPKPDRIRTVEAKKKWEFVCDTPDGIRKPVMLRTTLYGAYGCCVQMENLKEEESVQFYQFNEKNMQVYELDNPRDTTKLSVLDLTLGVGDEFTRSDGKRLVVAAVRDTVPFDSLNITCKLMELRGVDDATLTDTWIEGIGSVHTGILPPEWFEGTGTPHLVSCTLGSGDKATFAVPETNGIEVVDAKETGNVPLYDITGRRLVAPPTKGVYIEGGRKRVVR